MTKDQIVDSIELLSTILHNFFKKKDYKDLLDKSDKESLLMLQQALRAARRDDKRSNAWIKD